MVIIVGVSYCFIKNPRKNTRRWRRMWRVSSFAVLRLPNFVCVCAVCVWFELFQFRYFRVFVFSFFCVSFNFVSVCVVSCREFEFEPKIFILSFPLNNFPFFGVVIFRHGRRRRRRLRCCCRVSASPQRRKMKKKKTKNSAPLWWKKWHFSISAVRRKRNFEMYRTSPANASERTNEREIIKLI